MIKPKWSKVAVALGGTAAMIPLAAIFGLKASLLALFAASLKGNRQASELLRIKIRLMQQSESMGSFSYVRTAVATLPCAKFGNNSNIEEYQSCGKH